MSTIFLSGSRSITRLPSAVRGRLDNATHANLPVVVGDANGADKAFQRYLHDVAYDQVSIYCIEGECRNNLSDWPVIAIAAPRAKRDYRYFGAKDEAMAAAADYALMLWDGDSPGTLLNSARMARFGKTAVVFKTGDETFTTIKSLEDWRRYVALAEPPVRDQILSRWNEEQPRDLFAAA